MYQEHSDQKWGHLTYSQHGEDLMLLNIFNQLGIKNPSYIDIGAHHPTVISNTKLLYDRGSRGINVEANPNLMDFFRVERPEDTNLNLGVGVSSGVSTFYMYDPTSGRNTFSAKEVENYKEMSVKASMQIEVTTLDSIVKVFCKGKYPELLSCDIEGLDFDVLKTADFEESFPIVIVVETRKEQTYVMRDMLRKKGYFLYCRTGENLIFIYQTYYMRAF